MIIIYVLVIAILYAAIAYFLHSYFGAPSYILLLGPATLLGFVYVLYCILKREINLSLRKFKGFIKWLFSPLTRLITLISEKRASLTSEQILNEGIIAEINCNNVTITREDIAKVFEGFHLIEKTRHKGSSRPVYTFDYEKFFDLNNNYVKDKLFIEFYERFKNEDFSGIAILSERANRTGIFLNTTVDKEHKVMNAIKETIYLNDVLLNKKNSKDLFSDLPDGSKIIILQLMSEGEDGREFLRAAYDYIKSNPKIKVIGLLTFFSPLKDTLTTSDNLSEKVLVRLNLP